MRDQHHHVSSRGEIADHAEAEDRLSVRRHDTRPWFWNFQQSDRTGDRVDLALRKDRDDKPIIQVRMRTTLNNGVCASRTYAMVSICNQRSTWILLPDGSTRSEEDTFIVATLRHLRNAAAGAGRERIRQVAAFTGTLKLNSPGSKQRGSNLDGDGSDSRLVFATMLEAIGDTFHAHHGHLNTSRLSVISRRFTERQWTAGAWTAR